MDLTTYRASCMQEDRLRERAEKAEAELADCREELIQEQEANRNNCGNWGLQCDELKAKLAEAQNRYRTEADCK